jgi:hypothetical protein
MPQFLTSTCATVAPTVPTCAAVPAQSHPLVAVSKIGGIIEIFQEQVR